MARTGRRLAQALAVFAAVALFAACAEPDLSVGVPNTTTTAPPPGVTRSPDSSETPAPEPDGGGETASPPEAPPDPPVAPPDPQEPAAGGAEPPPTTAPPTRPAEDPEPPAPVEEPAASGQEPSEPPPPATGAEVAGLTAATLRVGVIADVETGGVADGRSRSVHVAIEAWAAAVNAAGGLAGRTIDLVMLDAGLFGHTSAIAEACAGDIFALVGSDALFDDEGIELLTEPGCNLVDFPALVHSPLRAAAPRTFQAVPVSSEVVNVGALRWVADRQPVRIRSTATFFGDLPATVIAAEQTAEAARSLGFELVYDPSVTIGESFDPYVEDMMAAGVHHILWDGDALRLVDLLASTSAAGMEVGVSCGSACHSALFLSSAGDSADGVLIWSPYLPLREESHNPELAAYRQWLEVVDPDATPDLQGLAAWAAGRLFEEAVGRAIGAGTPEENPDALSPAAVVAAARLIVNWHGHGLHGATDPGTGDPTPCGVVMGVNGGRLLRFHPVEPGTFDCSPQNFFDLDATALLGLNLPVEQGTADSPSGDSGTAESGG
jgi:hypothetical protein